MLVSCLSSLRVCVTVWGRSFAGRRLWSTHPRCPLYSPARWSRNNERKPDGRQPGQAPEPIGDDSPPPHATRCSVPRHTSGPTVHRPGQPSRSRKEPSRPWDLCMARDVSGSAVVLDRCALCGPRRAPQLRKDCKRAATGRGLRDGGNASRQRAGRRGSRDGTAPLSAIVSLVSLRCRRRMNVSPVPGPRHWV